MYLRVTIVKDRVSRKSSGVAFVLFQWPADAVKAVQELDNTEVRNVNDVFILC